LGLGFSGSGLAFEQAKAVRAGGHLLELEVEVRVLTLVEGRRVLARGAAGDLDVVRG
jgi:hypothetical protein